MNRDDILSGQAGLGGIHWMLHGQSSRRQLRSETQSMLRPGYRPGPFRLTRAKFKPGRKLSAYFTFPALDGAGRGSHPLHLAVAWQKNLEAAAHADGRIELQEAANRAGLMPVQSQLWREDSSQGIKLQVWPFDPEFPQLVRLGNPAYAAEMLESLGVAQGLKQMPVITPIRYRPGERHVLRYEISSNLVPSGGQRMYGKLYSSAEDAARAFRVANRVVDWLAANPQGLQGIRPKAVSLEDGVILYPHAPGVPLSHQLRRSRRWLAVQLQTIGGALAVLHSGPETMQAELRQNTFSNEAKVVKRACQHIQALLPEAYHRILRILDQAEERYSKLPQENPTFTHSDFKSDHMLITPQGLTLIDFDTCTLTDPALDLGKFLADLEWWFTIRGIPRAEAAQEELLKGYGSAKQSESILRERLARARLFHVLILVKIVARRVPIYRKEWSQLTTRLIERADHVFQKALAS